MNSFPLPAPFNCSKAICSCVEGCDLTSECSSHSRPGSRGVAGSDGLQRRRMQNRTGLILCALSLLTGFLMICLGGFFISNSLVLSQKNLVAAYVLLPMGFVILLSGIFWGTYRQANENKEMFNHVLRQHLAFQDLPLATVDRYVLSARGG